MNTFKTLLALILLVVAAAPAMAQAPVTASSDPESLFTSPDPRLNANKQVVMHIMRDLLEAGHWSDAPKYLSNRYIQHNPNIASGLEPVMKFFGSRPQGQIPARNAWRTKVVSVTAEGDLVVVGIVRELDDPRKPGAKYTTTWFDMWRIQDGKADEHWDYGTIAPPAAGTPSAPGGVTVR
ncbi:MAG TPA: nuclear transport factor 2 family protein [Vicinamibacterales bacterium]|nr:nuclear transport factor 2 family protein [Vicinamibacterales bacterium]